MSKVIELLQMSEEHHDHNDLKFEAKYWGNCTNTLNEDIKHLTYARFMQLKHYGKYAFDVEGKRILDIGGGPTSMLLKCVNLTEGKVCDPISYPQWTKDRYEVKNVSVQVVTGEDVDEEGWDEVWIYNVMQHCEDPERIIKNALKAAPVLRLFEWIDIEPHEGHPHMLTQASLERWIGKSGNTTVLYNDNECYGKAFYGVFDFRGDKN